MMRGSHGAQGDDECASDYSARAVARPQRAAGPRLLVQLTSALLLLCTVPVAVADEVSNAVGRITARTALDVDLDVFSDESI